MSKKLLLIEDDEMIVKALSVRLSKSGYDVTVAYDAVLAMTKAMDSRPDLILLDISMPGGNGFTVAERLRASAITGQTPLIFMTASNQQGLREQARSLGATAFFEKPIDMTQLLGAIAKALEPASVY